MKGAAGRGPRCAARHTPPCGLARPLPFEAVLYFRQWAESHARVADLERACAELLRKLLGPGGLDVAAQLGVK